MQRSQEQGSLEGFSVCFNQVSRRQEVSEGWPDLAADANHGGMGSLNVE